MSTEKKPTNFLLTLFVCLFVCLSIIRISTRRLSIRPSLIIRYIDDRIDVKNICLFNICIYIYIHRMNVERNANFRTNFFWIGQTKIRIHFKRRSLSDIIRWQNVIFDGNEKVKTDKEKQQHILLKLSLVFNQSHVDLERHYTSVFFDRQPSMCAYHSGDDFNSVEDNVTQCNYSIWNAFNLKQESPVNISTTTRSEVFVELRISHVTYLTQPTRPDTTLQNSSTVYDL